MVSIGKETRLKGLYFILNIDPDGQGEIPLWLEGVMANGCRIIQVRGKDMHPLQLTALTRDIVRIAKRYNVTVIVNDLPSVALDAGAHGVHLGAKDAPIREAKAALGPHMIVGATVRNVKQASKAIDAGADYIACGSIFKSPTKPSVEIIGVDTLKEIRDAFPVFPICAIGGITLKNVKDVIDAGADMVAVISGIASTGNPQKAALGYGVACEQKPSLELAVEDMDDEDYDDHFDD